MLQVEHNVSPKVIRHKWGRACFMEMNEDLSSLEGFEGIVDLYRSKSTDPRIPPFKADFHFQELAGWHAFFNLMHFPGAPEDGEIRILGEEYRRLFSGVLWQGMRLSEVDHPKLVNLSSYCARLIRTPCIGRFVGFLPHNGREHIAADILDLPARDEHGNVTYLLSFIRVLTPDDDGDFAAH